MPRIALPAEVRVWKHIVKGSADECWLWTGGTNGVYGVTGIGNRSNGTYRSAYAHRIVCADFNGPIPGGYEVDHLCSVPLCCNPRHLEAVTPRTNLMRSTSPSAQWAARDCCEAGHLFDEKNTGYRSTGKDGRHCRTCARNKQRLIRAGNKALGLRCDGKELKPVLLASHCSKGHEFTPENTYTRPGKGRECKACAAAYQRARRI